MTPLWKLYFVTVTYFLMVKIFQTFNISETITTSPKIYRMSLIDFRIRYRMTPLRKFYSMTLTYFFKVKTWNVTISKKWKLAQNVKWLCTIYVDSIVLSKMQIITIQAGRADLPSLVRHPPSSCSCFLHDRTSNRSRRWSSQSLIQPPCILLST